MGAPIARGLSHASPWSLHDFSSVVGFWKIRIISWWFRLQRRAKRGRDGAGERNMSVHVSDGELALEFTWHYLVPSSSLKLSPGGGEVHPHFLQEV